MLQDVRFALRMLGRRRGYAAMAVLTIALGVGANTAVFSVADSVLFRPLPFADADRLFMLRLANVVTGEFYGMVPEATLEAGLSAGLFDGTGAGSGFAQRTYVRGPHGLDVLELSMVSSDYMALLGMRPLLGRMFDESDAGTRAIVLSYRTWMRRYGGNPAVVGTTVATPEEPLRIVGVLAPRQRVPILLGEDGVIRMDGALRGGGASPPLVRLRRDVSLASAQARLGAIRGEGTTASVALRLIPLREEMSGRQGGVLWLLVVAAGIVLLVACVNLANLTLARGASRSRELAVRAALGGSRARLMRLLLIESACLAILGGIAGITLAAWAFGVLSSRLPPVLALVVRPEMDRRALLFALLCAAAAGMVSGALPAWRLSRADARGGLQLGGLRQHAPRRGRRALVALEIAICLALLVGAGLVGRSLVALLANDMGFASHRIVATFDLPALMIRTANSTRPDMSARVRFVQDRLRDLRAIPGVRVAGAAAAPPVSTAGPDARLFDRPGEAGGGMYRVSSGYFQAVGVPLVWGRDLTDAESFVNAPVGVLNESAARQLCGGLDCRGVVVTVPKQVPRTVVGVVRDARRSLARAATPAMYVPFDPTRFFLPTVVIDADDTPENRDGLSRALATSPDARVEVRSLHDRLERELSPFRFNAIVVGAFAVLTLGLAVVGVFGVMSAVVGERTREYGIRIALGATRAAVSRQVLRQAALPIGAGVAAGLLLAGWGSRFVASLLYGIVPLDGWAFGIAVGVVLVAALGAALVPARRAARVDPIVTLRAE